MDTLFWIIALLIVFIVIPFLRDNNQTKNFLKENPLRVYIATILETVNQAVFDNEAQVRIVSEKRVFLWRKNDSIYIDFWMGAGILFVEVHYRFFGADKKVTLKYQNAFNLTHELQEYIAREVVYTARQVRAKQLAATASVMDLL